MDSSDFISNKRCLDDFHDEHMNKKLRTDASDNSDVNHELKLLREIKHEKFNTVICFYELPLEDLIINNVSDAMSAVEIIFQTIVDGITANVRPSDVIQLSFKTPSLESAIHLPSMKCSALTVDGVIDQIEEKMHYSSHFVLEKSVSITCVRVRLPEGGVSKRKPEVDLDAFLHDSRSIIRIQNGDYLCCARAIVTARAIIEKHPKLKSIKNGNNIQRELAKELHQLAGVAEQQCGIEEIKKFQDVMPNYKISVISKECLNDFVYIGPNDGIPIYLYLHDDHYDVITKMTGFLNRSYFCEKCMKGYNDKERHKCNGACRVCHRFHADGVEKQTYCSDCNREFISDTCYRLHKEKTGDKATCDILFICKRCKKLINTKTRTTEHICGEIYCRTCKRHFAKGHKCYMQPIRNVNATDTFTQMYIFVGFQSIIDEVIECNKGYLPDERKRCINCKKSGCGIPGALPNVCVTHKVCSVCLGMEVTDKSTCSSCGPNKRIFQGRNSANLLCRWLFSTENKDATVLCYNLTEETSSHFLRYLYDNSYKPKVVTSGSTLKCIEVPVCKLRIIDSRNFIPIPLTDMAKSFDERPLQEGFFPILFNTKDNQNAVLNGLPDMQFYNVEDMKPETRNEFHFWYHSHRNDHFNFQEELLRYCESDVDIQRRCCLKFRTIFMKISKSDNGNGIDPFTQCIAIESACNTVYKSNYLEPESIAIIPHEGYKPEETQSTIAYQWMSYIAHKRGVVVQHARNIGEKKIGPYRVDGFYKDSNGQQNVLEFNGCFWHGCLNCYSRDTVNVVVNTTMDVLYKKTVTKEEYLKKHGYVYQSIWECDYKDELIKRPDMADYIKSLDIVSPIQPKDALYGGRTEGFKLFETTTEHKQIKYYDTMSLYPHINKTGKVPLGHPTIIKEDFESIDKYEGLIKCKILPPAKLYMPVLPVMINGEDVYSLCRSCSSKQQVDKCRHTEAGRAFTGTWVTDEVKLAVNYGYRVLKVYEVWHFERVSQYNQETKTDGAFTGYINSFLKLKEEASGWPKWCKSKDDKESFIESFYEREGIKLDYDNIKENPGLRISAELMLNSFSSKFDQRPNYVRSICITVPDKYFDLLTSSQIDVVYISFVSDETIRVDYVYKDYFVSASSQSNVVIAAYTTAQARIRLYDSLTKLGRRAIYCDTDVIAFTHIPGQWEPPLGDYIGDFADEVEGNQIISFATLGPKFYAYELAHPDKCGNLSVCKIRGFNMRLRSMLNINGQTMKDIVVSRKESSVKRNFNKRFVVHENNTFPYGFKKM